LDGAVKRLVVLFAVFSIGCFAHRVPPLPSGATKATLPFSLAVTAREARFPEDETRAAVDVLERTGSFPKVASASEIEGDLVVNVSRPPGSGWCAGDTVFVGFLSLGIIPGCWSPAPYVMEFSAPGSDRELEFHYQPISRSWVGWTTLFLNLRSDYRWYGGPDEDLEAAHLAAELSRIQVELRNLAARR
jgi:hypothetical protein